MKASRERKAEELRKASLQALETVSECKSHFYSLRRKKASKSVLLSALSDIQEAEKHFELVKRESLRVDCPNIYRVSQ